MTVTDARYREFAGVVEPIVRLLAAFGYRDCKNQELRWLLSRPGTQLGRGAKFLRTPNGRSLTKTRYARVILGIKVAVFKAAQLDKRRRFSARLSAVEIQAPAEADFSEFERLPLGRDLTPNDFSTYLRKMARAGILSHRRGGLFELGLGPSRSDIISMVRDTGRLLLRPANGVKTSTQQRQFQRSNSIPVFFGGRTDFDESEQRICFEAGRLISEAMRAIDAIQGRGTAEAYLLAARGVGRIAESEVEYVRREVDVDVDPEERTDRRRVSFRGILSEPHLRPKVADKHNAQILKAFSEASDCLERGLIGIH